MMATPLFVTFIDNLFVIIPVKPPTPRHTLSMLSKHIHRPGCIVAKRSRIGLRIRPPSCRNGDLPCELGKHQRLHLLYSSVRIFTKDVLPRASHPFANILAQALLATILFSGKDWVGPGQQAQDIVHATKAITNKGEMTCA